MISSRVWKLGAALSIVLSAGCCWAQASAPATAPTPALSGPFAKFPKPPADLPYLAFDQAWPARWGPADAHGIIVDVENPALEPQESRAQFLFEAPADHADTVALLKAAGEDRAKVPPIYLEGPGSLNFRLVVAKEGEKVSKARRNTASMTFKFISAQQEPLEGKPVIRIERTWFCVYEPTATEGEPPKPRGVALLTPGLLGTPKGTLMMLTNRLRSEGWVVLRMMAQPSRFTEQVTFSLDAAGDMEAQARTIAANVGGRAAECAYATQSAYQHFYEKRPDLKGLPRIAIGFSGGAMTLPTIVAREPGAYSASVLVGGGADYWLMNEQSSYRKLIDAIHEQWAGEKPAPEVFARLDELYLKNSPLDAYHTAAVLKGKPVLLIQGTADLAVPSPLGDLLWERLGKPERWLEEGLGHEDLFGVLPREFDRMMDWINKAVPRSTDK